jgi:hypothetical protein
LSTAIAKAGTKCFVRVTRGNTMWFACFRYGRLIEPPEANYEKTAAQRAQAEREQAEPAFPL